MSPVSSSLFSIYEYLALKALYGRRGGVIQQGKLMQIHAFSLSAVYDFLYYYGD